MLFSLLLVLLLAEVAMGQYNATVNPAVTELELAAYLGDWYQMAADPIVLKTIEKGAYCATAQYTTLDDGKVGVKNCARIDGPQGKDYVITGYAYQSNPDVQGELKVKFEGGESAPPFPAPYWIIALGPIVDSKYDWAIVSDNLSSFLFVLARDVNKYNSEYKDEILKILDEDGFQGFKKPVDMYQGSDCKYDLDSAASTVKAGVKGDTCDAITDEATCMSSMQGDEACAWCTSGAVGTSCQTERDAKSLPSSVFECEYQKAYAAY